jgi:hypothetical protein
LTPAPRSSAEKTKKVICSTFGDSALGHVLLALQKVEGWNLFGRFEEL